MRRRQVISSSFRLAGRAGRIALCGPHREAVPARQYDDAQVDCKKVAALFTTTPAPAEPLDAA
jgi:hypothetical protein